MTRLALLFDLDGTLIDSIGLLLECMEAAFANRERRPSRAQWTAGIGTPLRTQLAEWSDGPGDVEALVEQYRAYQDLHLERMTSLFPDVAETLAWARHAGHVTAIVTSKGRGMTNRSLRHVGIADAFDAIVTFEETSRHKPMPEPVFLALERLGTSADRAIFVGDSPHDMGAGLAAGVRTAAAQWGPFTRAELAVANPTYWMTRMGELPGIVTGFDRAG
ncbi:MAG: HAD-IA family hydrolase [Gemmatimonadaceae bacterium]|nr:HAD-IA family hydrolase [Gemmatimonadaceae bacterium]